MVVIYIPYLIVSQWRPAELENWGVPQYLGLIPITIGTAILLHCIWTFAIVGRGTLSSFDAPKHLVVQGLYRYVRNPMYLGVLLILLGEALLFDSMPVLEYAVGWFVLINLVVLLYEEPTLRRQFGESYDRYCRIVHRWLPGNPFNP
jgi:protein-S-isoprenylcysteine O-methyltransferase Ste14